jgi:hypothetical protein
MQRVVTKLTNGRDTQTYVIPGAESLRGQELQLRAEQIGGQRVLNLKFKVGENWDNKKNEAARAARPVPVSPPGPPATTPAVSQPKRASTNGESL